MKPQSYTAVVSLTQADFDSKRISDADLQDTNKFTCSDATDIANLERLLDVQPGTLTHEKLYVQRSTCTCGRTMTMYDFVFTALVDAEHDKSFVLHTLVGNKYIVNRPRRIRCSSCATFGPEHAYSMTKYGCQVHRTP